MTPAQTPPVDIVQVRRADESSSQNANTRLVGAYLLQKVQKLQQAVANNRSCDNSQKLLCLRDVFIYGHTDPLRVHYI